MLLYTKNTHHCNGGDEKSNHSRALLCRPQAHGHQEAGYPRSTTYDIVGRQKQGKDASHSPRVPGTLADATVPGWPEEIRGGQPKAANDHTGKEEGCIEENDQEVIGDLGDGILQDDKEAPPDSHHQGKTAQALLEDPFQAEEEACWPCSCLL